jgi:hypothetical protein
LPSVQPKHHHRHQRHTSVQTLVLLKHRQQSQHA